nr:MAG TPA: hypothetical protein [Caudoviricetes sp.]
MFFHFSYLFIFLSHSLFTRTCDRLSLFGGVTSNTLIQYKYMILFISFNVVFIQL